MPVLGAGVCPFGSCPAGYGVPSSVSAAVYVPYPDPVTGLAQSGYQVDVTKGDYDFTSDGRIVGCATVKSLVEHAIATTRGASAVPNFGLAPPGGVKTSGYQQREAAKVTSALQPFIDQGLLKIVSISFGPMASNVAGGFGVVRWVDLTAPPPTALNGGSPSNEHATGF